MNLRPSGYEPDELPGCSIPRHLGWPIALRLLVAWVEFHRSRDTFLSGLIRFGDDLLSHVLRRSTIGATALNGRVRDGTGCFARAMITKPGKPRIICPTALRLLEDNISALPPIRLLERNTDPPFGGLPVSKSSGCVYWCSLL